MVIFCSLVIVVNPSTEFDLRGEMENAMSRTKL
jgi:hypothetical protein